MHTKNRKKSSFTLLELIVAIIVVGISITAIPMLLNVSANAHKINIQEKSFFNAFSLLTLIQTQEWDENNTQGDNYYKVLTSNGGDSELKCIRQGVLQLDNESGATCASDNNKTSPIAVDSGEDENNVSTFDDIDDFNNYSTVTNETNITAHVYYVNDNIDYSQKNLLFEGDGDKVSDSNIKMVELNITNKDTHEVIAVLKYITSNIGMTKIESRSE